MATSEDCSVTWKEAILPHHLRSDEGKVRQERDKGRFVFCVARAALLNNIPCIDLAQLMHLLWIRRWDWLIGMVR